MNQEQENRPDELQDSSAADPVAEQPIVEADEEDNSPEAPSEGRQKRKFARYTAPMTIEINGTSYQAIDWSLGGFKISGIRDLALTGEKTLAQIILKISEFDFRFTAMVEMVRLDPAKREAAFRFIELSTEEVRVLGYVSSAFLAGRLKDVDGVLRHLGNSPDTGGEKVNDKEYLRIERRRTVIRRVVLSGLGIVAVLSARAALLTITGVSAVAAWVNAPMVAVSAPEPAGIETINVAQGQIIEPGEVVARLGNRELEGELANARAERAVLEARLEALRTIHAERMGVLDTERKSAEVARRQARIRRAELARTLESARTFAAAFKDVVVPGITTHEERVHAEEYLVNASTQLAIANKELAEAEARANAASAGFFYGDSRSTGFDPATLRVEIASLEQEIAAATVRIEGLAARLSELTLLSPCHCEVVELVMTSGERAEGQQPVLRLRPIEEVTTVSAFVGHQKARRLEVGQQVQVRLADGRRDRRARVSDIRTTSSMAGEAKLLDRDLNPERYSEVTIALSPEFADAPAAAVEVKMHWQALTWLADLFYF